MSWPGLPTSSSRVWHLLPSCIASCIIFGLTAQAGCELCRAPQNRNLSANAYQGMHTQRKEQRVENEGSTNPKQAGRGPSQSHDNSNEQKVSDCSLLLLGFCTARAPQH